MTLTIVLVLIAAYVLIWAVRQVPEKNMSTNVKIWICIVIAVVLAFWLLMKAGVLPPELR
jgi:hypothetical protein